MRSPRTSHTTTAPALEPSGKTGSTSPPTSAMPTPVPGTSEISGSGTRFCATSAGMKRRP